MSSIWTGRIGAGLLLLAGPGLALHASADIGPWTPRPERLALSLPFGFYAAASLGALLAVALAERASRLWGALLVGLAGPAVLLAANLLAWPVMFALSDARACIAPGLALLETVLVVPAAALQARLSPVPGRRRWLFAALLVVPGGALALAASFAGIRACSQLPEPPVTMLSPWAALASLVPLLVLVVWWARPVRVSRVALGLALAVAPIYGLKAGLDASSGGYGALLWPYRVWSDFQGFHAYNARLREVSQHRPGVPVRIGEHAYLFDRVRFWNPHVLRTRRPERLRFVQVDLPAEELDLPELVIRPSKHVQLNIGARNPTAPARVDPPDGAYISAQDEDLDIRVVAPRSKSIDRDEVRRKLKDYIRKVRVSEAPPG